MDDPLSSIDAHVGDHIFSNCIMGILKHKTRILCTHKTQYAEHADYLMVLSNGKVITHGKLFASSVATIYLSFVILENFRFHIIYKDLSLSGFGEITT